MKGFVVFNKDVFFCDDHDTAVFKNGIEYEILDENDDSIFVNSKPKTNECSEIPKIEEGVLFEYR